MVLGGRVRSDFHSDSSVGDGGAYAVKVHVEELAKTVEVGMRW